jgi:hypothetical protein
MPSLPNLSSTLVPTARSRIRCCCRTWNCYRGRGISRARVGAGRVRCGSRAPSSGRVRRGRRASGSGRVRCAGGRRALGAAAYVASGKRKGQPNTDSQQRESFFHRAITSASRLILSPSIFANTQRVAGNDSLETIVSTIRGMRQTEGDLVVCERRRWQRHPMRDEVTIAVNRRATRLVFPFATRPQNHAHGLPPAALFDCPQYRRVGMRHRGLNLDPIHRMSYSIRPKFK